MLLSEPDVIFLREDSMVSAISLRERVHSECSHSQSKLSLPGASVSWVCECVVPLAIIHE